MVVKVDKKNPPTHGIVDKMINKTHRQLGKEKLMQVEEAKFKSKYGNLKPCGGSALLTKRLQKSPDLNLTHLSKNILTHGDYNMAKAKMNNPKKPLPAQEKLILQETLGDAIPTPESLPTRKPSLIQSKLVDGSLS
ncbi:hypothetical protein FSP39_002145 [Pinctada imbricata]|uniref:Uncharacterized protein n=1 Tax=Pinctada imbricata TaxID=66713 RepID=A0AA88Y2Z1_PINIB|nr:hypothetical protein FSP39_002145 [Pinctada imbricata]